MRTPQNSIRRMLLPLSLLLAATSFAESPEVDEGTAIEAAIEEQQPTEESLDQNSAAETGADATADANVTSDTLVRVHIAGVASVDGQIVVSVYDSKKAWLKKPMHQAVTAAAISSTEEPLIVEMELPEGEYAIHVFHDADDNGKMKTNFIGIPKEPTGVSNDAKGRFGPPKFVDATVSVGTEPLDIPINMVKI